MMSDAKVGQILKEHSYFVEMKTFSSPVEATMVESHPIVSSNSNAICLTPNPQRVQSYAIPRSKAAMFYPHWAQDLMDKNLKFYLSAVDEDNKAALTLNEGRMLMDKIRYIFARFTWDAENPVGVRLHLAENHGNVKFPRRHRFRPLLANSVFVDNYLDTISIQGTDFNFTLGVPFPGDVRRHPNDPGCRIDVGLYSRGLDSNPTIRLKWYISLRREDLPQSALNIVDLNADEDDDDDSLSWMDIA